LASLYTIIFSHYFSLKSVDIIRNDNLVNIDLAYRSIENIRLKPMVFINKSDIRNFITSHQPNIQNIEIRKIYPSNIKITLSSYKELYNVNVEGKYYKITEN
jgi:cell division septal protein FtsQ